MKIKKLSLAAIFLAVTVIAYIVATVLCSYTTKPEVLTGEFPFSITYEYKGETNTLSGVLKCEYGDSRTTGGEHSRYWAQETVYHNADNVEDPRIIEQNDELQTTLSIQEHMVAGYFMGDPLYADEYTAHGQEGPAPYVQYYDYINEIYLDDENRDEVFASIGFKIIDFTYAEPIENSFSFSGVQYEADNVLIFVAIMAGYLALCLVFVRKDKEHSYSNLDKIGVVFNFLVAIFALPFITLTCIFFGLAESPVELLNQITYNVPSITVLCLALSVVFRRKGFSLAGFLVQFGGIPLYILVLVLDAVVHYV